MSDFRSAMPNMVRHAGEWEGVYTHIASDGALLDRYHVSTRCDFPGDGPYAYIQTNRMRWDDGRTAEFQFGGVFRDGLLHWDTERFRGYGWETREGVVMLKLDRLDDPGCHYVEMISLAADGQSRARTWQWFRDGTPWKRTLCDERRTA